MRILIAYATAHGSTQGIAERIAAGMEGRGFDVDCVPVDEVRNPDEYDAFVVGSAIHAQAWLPEAVRFITTHEATLAARPSWLFSVGMPGALAKPLQHWAMSEGPKVVAGFEAGVHPRGTHLFTGVVSPEQFPDAKSRAVFRALGGRWGDYRDWADVDEWVGGIVHELIVVPTG
jgi:menaquinone-dependent protoporphyrinogen oxidase